MPKTMPMAMNPDGDWRAEQDARTLAEARVIMKDPKRHEAAIKAASKMAQEKMTHAKAMKSVASKKVRSETAGTKLRSE